MSAPSQHWLNVDHTLIGVHPWKVLAVMAVLTPVVGLVLHGLIGAFFYGIILHFSVSEAWIAPYAVGMVCLGYAAMAWCLKSVFQKT